MNPRVTVGLLAVLIALGAYVYFGPTAGTLAPSTTATPTTVVQLDLWKLDDGQIQAIERPRRPDGRRCAAPPMAGWYYHRASRPTACASTA